MADEPGYLAPIGPHAFRTLREVEDNHWWFDGMEVITRHVLDEVYFDKNGDGTAVQSGQHRKRQILDAGCGTGRNLGFLGRYGVVTGLDHSTDALTYCHNRNFRQLVCGSVNRLPFVDAIFDLVTCFDVLITDGVDDTAALPEFARVLRPGGFLFIRVAAYDWLRSYHDIEWSVRHRYNRTEIRAKLATANLEVEIASYANTWLLPIALLKRLVERARRNPAPRSDLTISAHQSVSSRLLRAILSSEARWIKRPSLPCGLSLIALARKPAH